MLLWIEHDGVEYRIELTHRLRGASSARDEEEVVIVALADPHGFQQGVRCAMGRATFERLRLAPRSDAVLRHYAAEIARRMDEILAWSRARGGANGAYFDLVVADGDDRVEAPPARAAG